MSARRFDLALSVDSARRREYAAAHAHSDDARRVAVAAHRVHPLAHRDDELDAASAAGYLFSVFPISSGNDFQGAIRDAIRQRDGDALIQVTAETYYQNFLIVSRYCTIVQGIAVRNSPPVAPAR